MSPSPYRMEPRPPVELPKGVSHGSHRAYNTYGCRCAECLEHRRSYDRTLWELKERQRRRNERNR